MLTPRTSPSLPIASGRTELTCAPGTTWTPRPTSVLSAAVTVAMARWLLIASAPGTRRAKGWAAARAPALGAAPRARRARGSRRGRSRPGWWLLAAPRPLAAQRRLGALRTRGDRCRAPEAPEHGG